MKNAAQIQEQNIQLNCEALSSEAAGIARMDGMVVFIPGALPGERVLVHIQKRQKRFAIAELVEILQPSPDRQPMACPHAHVCGGCALQHMRYSMQLEFKQNKVRDALERIGGFSLSNHEVRPTMGMQEPFRYRNKAEYAISPLGVVGFYQKESHRIIDASDCMLQHPTANAMADAVRSGLQSGNKSEEHIHHLVTRVTSDGSSMAILTTSTNQIDSSAWVSKLTQQIPEMVSIQHSVGDRSSAIGYQCRTLWGRNTLLEKMNHRLYELSPQSFFQINMQQTSVLFQTVLDAANLSGKERVLDAYCGVGALALQLAGDALDVLGIEVIPEAIENAKRNMQLNDISNATFVCAEAEKELPKRVLEGYRPDVVVVDPPRKGCDEALLQALLQASPQRIVYVSCDPATLARDARILSRDYDLSWVQPVDMFPWTYHVETVVLMSKS